MTTNQKISLAILSKMASGMDIRDAVDTVLGKGTYEKLAHEVWMQARAAAGMAA